MAVSPLITRGFGPTPTIITLGLAPPEKIASVIAQLQLHGADASIRTKRDWEAPHVKKPWIDTFTICATLRSVNGEQLQALVMERIDVIDDSSDSFKIKTVGNVEVNKTIPENDIFITVLNLFKRQ